MESAIRLYGLPAGTVARLFSVSENHIYQLAAPDGTCWALRLERPGYQSAQSLASEMAWIAALRQQAIVVTPAPHAGLDGNWVQRLPDPETGRRRSAVLFSWESGVEPSIDTDLRACLQRLGVILARMHAHSRGWPPPAGFVRFRWDVQTALGEAGRWGRWRDGLGMNPARAALFDRAVAVIRARLTAFGEGPDRFGVVHFDLRLGNLLVEDEAVKVLDFDDCGFSWYMADVANCLSFHEHLPQAKQWLGYLLEGYRTVGQVSDAEEAELPTFLLMRRLLLVAWIGSHSNAPLAQGLGAGFTAQSELLAKEYLTQMG